MSDSAEQVQATQPALDEDLDKATYNFVEDVLQSNLPPFEGLDQEMVICALHLSMEGVIEHKAAFRKNLSRLALLTSALARARGWTPEGASEGNVTATEAELVAQRSLRRALNGLSRTSIEQGRDALESNTFGGWEAYLHDVVIELARVKGIAPREGD